MVLQWYFVQVKNKKRLQFKDGIWYKIDQVDMLVG